MDTTAIAATGTLSALAYSSLSSLPASSSASSSASHELIPLSNSAITPPALFQQAIAQPFSTTLGSSLSSALPLFLDVDCSESALEQTTLRISSVASNCSLSSSSSSSSYSGQLSPQGIKRKREIEVSSPDPREQQKRRIELRPQDRATRELDLPFLPYFYEESNRVHPGLFITNNLNLQFSVGNFTCKIPDQTDNDPLSLHDRMQRELAKNVGAPSYDPWPPCRSDCFTVANLGFVVSSKPSAEGDSDLKFVTLPVYHPENIRHVEIPTPGTHAELQLYLFLSKEETINLLLIELQNIHGITKEYTIYAVVLDLHSTYHMCEDCENETYKIMGGMKNKHGCLFLPLLVKILGDRGYGLPKPLSIEATILTPLPTRPTDNIVELPLPFVVRVSGTSFFKGWGNLPKDSCGAFYPCFGEIYTAPPIDLLTERNISRFANSVILHRPVPLNRESAYSSLREKIEQTEDEPNHIQRTFFQNQRMGAAPTIPQKRIQT